MSVRFRVRVRNTITAGTGKPGWAFTLASAFIEFAVIVASDLYAQGTSYGLGEALAPVSGWVSE